VVGEVRPAVDVRQDMLAEAIEIIPALHTGEMTTFDGDYFRVDSGGTGGCLPVNGPTRGNRTR